MDARTAGPTTSCLLSAPDQWCPRRSTHPLEVDRILELTMDEKAVQEALQQRFAEVWDRLLMLEPSIHAGSAAPLTLF